MFSLRRTSPFTRIPDQTPLGLLPKPVEAVTLRGFLAEPGMPFAPTSSTVGGGIPVVTSPVTHHLFPEREREDLERLVGVHCWDDAAALIEPLTGSDDPEDWAADGLLVRFPGEFAPADFPTVFKGLALVSLTHNRLASPLGHNAARALLHAPGPDGTGTDPDESVPVPVALHTLLSRSDGMTDLPAQMLDQTRGDIPALETLTKDVCAALPHLLGSRIAALVHAR